MIIYQNNHDILALTTLAHDSEVERGNTALHTTSQPESVIQHRQAVCDRLGLKLDSCTFAKQTHSDHFRHVTSEDKGKGACQYDTAIEDCDALYTKDIHHPIGVFTADCLGILLYDPQSHLIGAIHSGWAGTLKQITYKTIAHLIEHEGLNPQTTQVYLCPCIQFKSLEMGNDLIEQFKSLPFDITPYVRTLSKEKSLLDNRGLNIRMMTLLGIPESNIQMSDLDTFCDAQMFSYRRDKSCGRHLSMIVMKK